MIVRRAAYHIHVIPHLHWSSVPGASEDDLRLRLVARLDRLLDRLADPNDMSLRSLLLDGQTSLIEDYLTLRPERYDQIEELVRDGKLALGPWYVQPDGAIAGVELLIRNLSLGLRTARTFGPALEVGYLHTGATVNPHFPQILRGFGMETALWLSDKDEGSSIECNWQSPDGSQVVAVGLPDDLTADASAPLHDLAALRQQLASRTIGGHIPLLVQVADPSTTDFDGLDRLSKAIQAANKASPDTVFQSALPGYFKTIRPLARGLPVIKASSPADGSRLWLTWRGSRTGRNEWWLCRVEAIVAWAELNTLGAGSIRLRNPRTILETAWRELLRASAAGLPDSKNPICRVHFKRARQLWYWLIHDFKSALNYPDTLRIPTIFDQLFQHDSQVFTIIAVKLPDDPERGGLIVRGWNTGNEPHQVTLRPWRPFGVIDVMRLDESETGGKLAIEHDGSFAFRAAPHRLLTFWLHD